MSARYMPNILWIPPKEMDEYAMRDSIHKDREIHEINLIPARELHSAKSVLNRFDPDAVLLQTMVLLAHSNGKVATRFTVPNDYQRFHPAFNLLLMAQDQEIPAIVSSSAYALPKIRRQVLASGARIHPSTVLTRHLITDLLEAIHGQATPHEEYEGR